MACVSKIGSLYEMVTKNVIVSTTNTIFGINPRAWIALPCEGLILLKIRQVVPTAGSALPVQIAVPANSTVSTVGADTCCSVTGVNVVNPINVAVTGAAMVNGTERLLYSNALADEAVKKMVNVDGSKRIWKQPEIKDIFEKCGAKKPDKATWGDVQYVFAMYYSDGFPKVFKCENELVKATLMYLDDPDAPEGVAFIRWLAVQDYLGEKINWKDLT